MTRAEKQILNRFKRILADELDDGSVELRLFGSKARGEDRADSDVDVLVIVSGESWQIADKVYGVATDLMLETGVCLSPKVVSRRQYKELTADRTPFLLNIEREGLAV